MKKRGFGGMSEEQRAHISSMGGKAAHAMGVAHEFTTEEAREAGQKGGAKVAEDRDHMSEIGKKGGKATQRKRAKK